MVSIDLMTQRVIRGANDFFYLLKVIGESENI